MHVDALNASDHNDSEVGSYDVGLDRRVPQGSLADICTLPGHRRLEIRELQTPEPLVLGLLVLGNANTDLYIQQFKTGTRRGSSIDAWRSTRPSLGTRLFCGALCVASGCRSGWRSASRNERRRTPRCRTLRGRLRPPSSTDVECVAHVNEMYSINYVQSDNACEK